MKKEREKKVCKGRLREREGGMKARVEKDNHRGKGRE